MHSPPLPPAYQAHVSVAPDDGEALREDQQQLLLCKFYPMLAAAGVYASLMRQYLKEKHKVDLSPPT